MSADLSTSHKHSLTGSIVILCVPTGVKDGEDPTQMLVDSDDAAEVNMLVAPNITIQARPDQIQVSLKTIPWPLRDSLWFWVTKDIVFMSGNSSKVPTCWLRASSNHHNPCASIGSCYHVLRYVC